MRPRPAPAVRARGGSGHVRLHVLGGGLNHGPRPVPYRGVEAYDIVRALVDALPVGSALFLSHPTSGLNAEKIAKVAETYHERGFTFVPRSSGFRQS
ncbi:SAM-dependent methyltransferase [Streptomyces sp. NPDC056982]|uniref:SAM-dependent methyltransferase n=1 Tax=Streptomyces sp. NPDC056982 TaxID=3345986 RepID=UPI00362A1CD5